MTYVNECGIFCDGCDDLRHYIVIVSGVSNRFIRHIRHKPAKIPPKSGIFEGSFVTNCDTASVTSVTSVTNSSHPSHPSQIRKNPSEIANFGGFFCEGCNDLRHSRHLRQNPLVSSVSSRYIRHIRHKPVKIPPKSGILRGIFVTDATI